MLMAVSLLHMKCIMSGRTKTFSDDDSVISGKKFILGELIFPRDSQLRSVTLKNICPTIEILQSKFHVSLA